MDYAKPEPEDILRDFYEKEDVGKEFNLLWEYRGIISGQIASSYKGDPYIGIYNGLVKSVEARETDDYGDVVVNNPIDQEGHGKDEDVFQFVLNGFEW